MPLVMPDVQVDIDTPIVIFLMRDGAPCNPLADSIRPDPKNLCRLRHRVPLRNRRVLLCHTLHHTLHHALIMPAVLGILPLPEAFALVRSHSRRCVMRSYRRSGSSRRMSLGWRSGIPRSSLSMALNTAPAILSPSMKTLLGTPVLIASRRSRGLLATMTTSPSA